MSLGAKRAAREAHIYHATPHHPGTPEHLRGRVDPHAEGRAGLLRELAMLTERAEGVRARLREMGGASEPARPRV